jgi:pyruvate/2-oxoglutarate dehydrogenase complex dihydrolipoamide acyltransferase (E2) component
MPLGARLRHGLAVGAAMLVMTPATALAQGAGDDQYSDPFGSEQGQATPTATPRAPAPAPAATAAPAQATPAPSQPGPAATPAPSGPTLPYTGVDDWLTAAGGALLLGAGLTLRARLREPG